MIAAKTEILSQGSKAFESLQKYCRKEKKNLLFPEDDQSLFVMIKYKRVPLAREAVRRRFVTLPHSDRSPLNTSVCLILPDFDKSKYARKNPDVDEQARKWADKLEQKFGISGKDVAKIFTFNQLKREYSQVADKAKLANTYDIFLVDSKLQTAAFAFLGSNFKKPTKMLLPVHAESGKLGEEISRSYNIVNLPLEPLKDSFSIRIGNVSQSESELRENLSAIIDSAFENCPGGFANFKACYIQTKSAKISIPIYADFGPANEIKLKENRKREFEAHFEDCSTLPEGLAVKVRPDGAVFVVDEKTQDEVIFPTLDDEWEKNDDLKPNESENEKLIKQRSKEALKKIKQLKREEIKTEEKQKKLSKQFKKAKIV